MTYIEGRGVEDKSFTTVYTVSTEQHGNESAGKVRAHDSWVLSSLASIFIQLTHPLKCDPLPLSNKPPPQLTQKPTNEQILPRQLASCHTEANCMICHRKT